MLFLLLLLIEIMIKIYNIYIKYINTMFLKIYKNKIKNIILIIFYLWNIINSNIITIIFNRKENIKNSDIDLF